MVSHGFIIMVSYMSIIVTIVVKFLRSAAISCPVGLVILSYPKR